MNVIWMPVIAASVTAIGNIIAAPILGIVVGRISRRDEARIRESVEKRLLEHKSDLDRRVEFEVRAVVATQLRIADARLRVVSEARLKFLDKQITDVGNARVALNRAFAAMHRFLSETWKKGVKDDYAQLMRGCEESIRDAMLAGGLLPREIREVSLKVAHDLEKELEMASKWAAGSQEEKTVALQAIEDRLLSTSGEMSLVFDSWMQTQQDTFDEAIRNILNFDPELSSVLSQGSRVLIKERK